MVPGKEIVPMALPGERVGAPAAVTPAEKDKNKVRVLPSSRNGQHETAAEGLATATNEAKELAEHTTTVAREQETEVKVATAVPSGESVVYEPETSEDHSLSKSIAATDAPLPDSVKETEKNNGERTSAFYRGKNSKLEMPTPATSTDGIVYIKPHPDVPIVLNRTDLIAQEAFGILRSRLLKARETGLRTILFTSAEQGEGKTVMSVNAALSLAQIGQKRILLIDGDLRVCGVTEFLGLGTRPGLSEWLRKEKPLETVIHATNLPNLSVVPAGHTPEGMLLEALEGSRWSEFIEAVKEKFDLILVDSLPVSAPVVDLELLLAPCDAYLITVQIGKTTRNSMRKLAHWADPQKLLGVIVNNAEKLSDGSYHYGYYGSKYNKYKGK